MGFFRFLEKKKILFLLKKNWWVVFFFKKQVFLNPESRALKMQIFT